MTSVSVIVPVYNVEPCLCRCVDSLLAQTFTNHELILVNDGSSDNCGAICDRYAGQDSRVHVIHQENGGLSAARNAGIDWVLANSSSQWLTFVDGDDYVSAHFLERLYRLAAEDHTKCSMCGYSILDQKGLSGYGGESRTFVLAPDEAYGMSFPEGCRMSVVSSCFKLFHISLFRDVRFPAGRIHEDRFTTHRLLFQCDRISITTDPLYIYDKLSGGSITHRPWTPERMDDFDACEEQMAFFGGNGFDRAYRKAINDYFIVLNQQLDSIRLDRQNKREYFRPVRTRLRRFYREHRDEIDISMISDPWYYKYIYPVTAFFVRAAGKIARSAARSSSR